MILVRYSNSGAKLDYLFKTLLRRKSTPFLNFTKISDFLLDFFLFVEEIFFSFII
jgi:hypothetical protein